MPAFHHGSLQTAEHVIAEGWFSRAGFGPELLKSCAAFATPSPIQTECWAPACSGADLVGIAATGSGKTLAFGLPALGHVRAQLAANVADGAPSPPLPPPLPPSPLPGPGRSRRLMVYCASLLSCSEFM